MKKIKVVITLLEEMLGTASANPELYKTFIESNRPITVPAEDETATLPAVDDEVNLGTTVFHRDEDGRPFIYDYQIKGFFKDSCNALARVVETNKKKGDVVEVVEEGSRSSKLKAYKKVIDGTIFVSPRRIRMEIPAGGEVAICERPIRCQTAQGERIALARSETVPAGTVLRFDVTCMVASTVALVEEWLEYAVFRGLGQWRNSGKGRFETKFE